MNIYLFLPSNFVKRYTKIVNIHFYLCQTIYTISKIKYKFIIYIYIYVFLEMNLVLIYRTVILIRQFLI